MSLRPGPAMVSVPLTTLWVGPDRPRDVDRPVVAAAPDAVRWLADLDSHPDDDESGDGRLGLHGRVESQLVAGEPVRVVGLDEAKTWAQVVCPWQPSPKSPDGYPGWVPAAHLRQVPDASGSVAAPAATARPAAGSGEHPALALARDHLGLAYLWGGLSPLGFDCSGLVHHTWRRLGVVVPRDADAQAEAALSPDPGEARPGDLYFFGRPGRVVHHVGIVVSPGRMVHASETRGAVVEEDLTADRLEALVATGRLPTS
ncbi:MAG TPA: C40 family peptidase [Intrasporangium sp.]|uniref:C40 family peptidase n=1 Tax=Intrasporangium sp. TaxID=1925024 RepID=UPI002D7959D5|nr:C40 family peptidase [Intrasporangium sp.]HET7398438.1 C40 family peptidase [Intrasporangium sp.]